MKDDIKKRFLDILFEPEELEEKVEEAPLKEVRINEEKLDKEEKVIEDKKRFIEASNKAKDILYNKQSSPFINIDEKIAPRIINKPSFVKTEATTEYVMRPNISPMFGVIKPKDVAQEPVKETKTVKKEPEKKFDSYLGTVISPIYGYNVKNDYSNTMNLSINKIQEAQEVFEEVKEQEEKALYENDSLNDTTEIEDIAKQVQQYDETLEFDNYSNEFEEDPYEEEPIEEETVEQEETKPVENTHLIEEAVTEAKALDEEFYSTFSLNEVEDDTPSFSDSQEIDLFEDLFDGEQF